jgi:CheY-like chemotaxis protein
MQRQNDGPENDRGTILVASDNALFATIVGEMVAHCGFSPAFRFGDEEPRRSLARTQPCVVICDCTAPAHGIQHLIADASSRHIPLVLSDMRMPESVNMRTLTLARQLAWLTFPISRAAFGAMLDGLLPPFIDVLHTVATSVAGISIAAAVSVRTLARANVLGNPPGAHIPEQDVTDRPRTDRLVDRGAVSLADAMDLRSTIVAALAAKPVYEQSLRRAVETYVAAERDAGASPGQVMLVLTELVGAARIVPASVAVALTRQVILWCVEAYFGQLGVEGATRDGDIPHAEPVLVSNR